MGMMVDMHKILISVLGGIFLWKTIQYFSTQFYIKYLSMILNCISDWFLLIVAGDLPLPKDKLCFDSTLCPTAPELCNHFCVASAGHPKGGSCFNNLGICCCNLTV